jgi:uncharacterized protein with WD repeat
VTSVVFSPNGENVASADAKKVRVWSVKECEEA